MDISIIIPTYNRLWSLEKAIGSCRATRLATEIIVVDDGSTDNTAEWLKTQDDLVIISQRNQGKDWAVNKGVSIAQGKYIRFLDSDDWILPYSNDALFEKAELGGFDVVAAGYQIYNEDEKMLEEKPWIECDDFLAQQLGECDSSHYSAYLFKREFIKSIPHRQEFGSRDDRQFVIEVALEMPKAAFVEIPTLAHRAHTRERLQQAEGLTDTLNNYAAISIYRKCLLRLMTEGRSSDRYNRIAAKMLWPVAHWIAKTHLKEAIKLLSWIHELDPHFEIPDQGLIGTSYRKLGFTTTERILKLRRFLKYGWQ